MHHEHSSRVRGIPPTWRPVYLTGQRSVQATKRLPFEQRLQWGQLWGTGVYPSFSAEDREYPARQGEDVWEAFSRLNVPVRRRRKGCGGRGSLHHEDMTGSDVCSTSAWRAASHSLQSEGL